LSGGKASYQLEPVPERETRVSQVFIAIDSSSPHSAATASQVADEIIEHFQSPAYSAGESVRYPGYRVLQTRRENLAHGIPVEPFIWQQLQSF
jgi:3-dehydro-L-gulonate 2-dehydrogenase